MLARRLVPEADNYRLETLKDQFRITPRVSHQAKADVLNVVELFQNVYRQRLEGAGICTYENVLAFTKKTPVAKCLALIDDAAKNPKPTDSVKDEWYYLDSQGDDHGPATAKQAVLSVGLEHFYVWREGMSDWKVNIECPEFIKLSQENEALDGSKQKCARNKTIDELIGVCRGLIADERITTAEVMYLHSWLQDVGFVDVWPATEIVQTVEKILEDGVVKMKEKAELKELIERVLSS